MAKAKSLTEAAKEVLSGQSLQEGIPAIGPIGGGVSNPNPVDGSTASTRNAKTLRPGSGSMEQRHAQNGAGAPGPEAFPGAEDLGGTTPTSTAKDNLGAKAAGGKKRDTSIKGSGTNEEPAKKLTAMAEDMEEDGDVVEEMTLAQRLKALKEARKMEKEKEEDEDDDKEHKSEKCDEELEISEELEDFINEAIEAGLSEEEIIEAIEENFEFISEEEQLDEVGDTERGQLALHKVRNRAFNRAAAAGPGTMGDGSHSPKTVKKNLDIEAKAKKRLKEEDLSEELEDYEIDMSEHVNALLEGENLSEEFHEKATTIFEAAVKAKLEEEVALLEQAYAETLEERVASIEEELTAQVDDYLNYVVEQWIEENEIAVESALRSELTEDFISGLRALFAEHYIDVPEEEVAVVEELAQTVENLEAKLNEEIQRNVELTSILSEARKIELTNIVCEGLTTTQTEKLKTLAENVAYTSDEEFIEKIGTLRENYFPTAVKSSEVLDRVESDNPSMISESTLEGPMARYVQALGKTLK